MAQTLQQRQLKYEASYRQHIIERIPVVIKIDGRNFSRATKNTHKPFCKKTMALLNGTMLALAKKIDGVVFGYQYMDKIILILRNDRNSEEDPWFGNECQKMASVSSSIATYECLSQLWAMSEAPQLEGEITFSSHVFGVPSINEAINYLLYRQFRCMQSAVNDAVQSVLWPRYGEKTNDILEDKNLDERRKILDEAGFDFDSMPSSFRHGSAAYLVPSLVNTMQGQVTRHKWLLDFEIPLFTDSKEWLRTILTTGSDIFRPERDYNEPLTKAR